MTSSEALDKEIMVNPCKEILHGHEKVTLSGQTFLGVLVLWR